MPVGMQDTFYFQKKLNWPKAKADNTNQGLDNFHTMQKPNPIFVLLCNCKSTEVDPGIFDMGGGGGGSKLYSVC